MTANISGGSTQDKIRLLTVTAGMELYTIAAAIVGILTSNSVSFVTNLLIAVTGFIATSLSLYTVRKMAAVRDDRYGYGFGKLETASSLVVAATMILTMLVIAYETVHRLIHPVNVEGGGIGLALTAVSGLVSGYLWFRNYRISKVSPSPIFDSMWRLCRQGAVEDALIIGAVGLGTLFHDTPWGDYLDPLASLVLLAVLASSVFAILSGTMDDLLDRSLGEYHQLLILRALAKHFDEYEHVHEIRSRRSGTKLFVELFLEFAHDKPMGEVYASIGRLKAELHTLMPNTDVLIVPTTHETVRAPAPAAEPVPA